VLWRILLSFSGVVSLANVMIPFRTDMIWRPGGQRRRRQQTPAVLFSQCRFLSGCEFTRCKDFRGVVYAASI